MDTQPRYSIVHWLILGGIILVMGLGSFFAVTSIRSQARDAIRLSSMREFYYGLEVYFSRVNDYPAGDRLVLGGANAQCLDEKGFHGAGGCTGFIIMPQILPDIGGLPQTYSYLQGPPPSYAINFQTEGAVGTVRMGNHRMTPSELK